MKIGVTARFQINSYNELNFLYEEKLLKTIYNNFPECAIQLIQPYSQEIHDIDLVILSGGDTPGDNQIRDQFEISILEKCLAMKIPVIGICRGAQLIAYWKGASITKIDNHINQSRSINGFGKSLGRCFHNYTITSIPHYFEVIARDEQDNSIELYFSNELRAVGILSHPERLSSENKSLSILFDRFLAKF